MPPASVARPAFGWPLSHQPLVKNDFGRAVDDEVAQFTDASVAMPLVECSGAIVEGRHEQEQMSAISEMPLGEAQEFGADAASSGIRRDSDRCEIRRRRQAVWRDEHEAYWP